MHAIKSTHSPNSLFQNSDLQESFSYKTAFWIRQTEQKGFVYKIAVYALVFFASIVLVLSLIGIPYAISVFKEYQILNQRNSSLESNNTLSSIESESIHSSSTEVVPAEKTSIYSNRELIQKICALSEKRLHLVIGIAWDYPLVNQDPEQLWVSLDSGVPEAPLSENRYHLVLNRNLNETAKNLANVFSSILIYPTKFEELLYHPGFSFQLLHQMLKKEESSSLLFEPTYLFLPSEQFSYSEDGTSVRGPENHIGLLSQTILIQSMYLQTNLFHSASVHVNEFFPLIFQATTSWPKTNFIIAQDPQ